MMLFTQMMVALFCMLMAVAVGTAAGVMAGRDGEPNLLVGMLVAFVLGGTATWILLPW